MKDSFDREIDYLRISVTQRCNCRCLYCMPDKPFSWVAHENILSFESLFEFAKIAIDNGVKKIRITGGEPLVRKDVEKFVKMIADYAPNIDLAMTTNAVLFENFAKILKENGLKRVNISLDTLRSEIALKIAKKDILTQVLVGIDAALSVGLKVKLNCVVMRGINENEICDLVKFACKKGVQIRFIEFMENTHANSELKGVCKDEILKILNKEFEILEIKKDPHSPSSLFEISKILGGENSENSAFHGYKFGIISPHSDEFCKSCNRIRLSAEGFLIPCLYFDEAKNIKKALDSGDLEGAKEIFKSVILNKPEKNRWGNLSDFSAKNLGQNSENSSDFSSKNSTKTEISNRAFYQTGG